MNIVDVRILTSQVVGAGGFVQLRRLKVQNLRRDGSWSAPYTLDMVERPGRCDAVTVVAYDQDPVGQTRVLLRRGIRPVLRLGRAGQPTREGKEPAIENIEAVAGILEPEDQGEAGLWRRAIQEIEEETGIVADVATVEMLGPPVYALSGLMAERSYFCRVPVALGAA